MATNCRIRVPRGWGKIYRGAWPVKLGFIAVNRYDEGAQCGL